MGGPYVKLFGSILSSSVWCEPAETKLVWITLLLLADSEGRVWGSVPGIARQAGITTEAARRAIKTLCSPDADSRTQDEQGRRLLPIDGGWRIVNARKYRDLQTDGQQKASARAKRYRDRKASGAVTRRDDRDASRLSRTEEEEEEEEEAQQRTTETTERSLNPSLDQLAADLAKNSSFEAAVKRPA